MWIYACMEINREIQKCYRKATLNAILITVFAYFRFKFCCPFILHSLVFVLWNGKKAFQRLFTIPHTAQQHQILQFKS